MPPRSLKVLARAAEVDAILKVAMTDAPGGALSASATRGRAEALRPLDHAVRAARRAAIDEAVRAMSDRSDHADTC
jgi:cell pole-organizing protein PopZ